MFIDVLYKNVHQCPSTATCIQFALVEYESKKKKNEMYTHCDEMLKANYLFLKKLFPSMLFLTI